MSWFWSCSALYPMGHPMAHHPALMVAAYESAVKANVSSSFDYPDTELSSSNLPKRASMSSTGHTSCRTECVVSKDIHDNNTVITRRPSSARSASHASLKVTPDIQQVFRKGKPHFQV